MAISWVALLTLMVDGPDPAVRGVIRSVDGSDESRRYAGVAWMGGQPRPVFAGAGPGDVRRVWRDGARVRVEDGDGRVALMVDGRNCWQFDREHDVPVETPADTVRYHFGGTGLLQRRPAESWVGTDFTRPTGPVGETTFLGRAAYTVELAPPPHKPYPLQLVVDAATGLVLQQRNDGFGSVDEWIEFVAGETFDDALFTWNGPVRSWRAGQAARDAAHEADLAARRTWFTEHVAPLPLRVEVAVNADLNEFGDDGSFRAHLEWVGMLTRRPRGTGPAGRPADRRNHGFTHRWSDARWDWTLDLQAEEPLTPAALASLQRQLGSTPTEPG